MWSLRLAENDAVQFADACMAERSPLQLDRRQHRWGSPNCTGCISGDHSKSHTNRQILDTMSHKRTVSQELLLLIICEPMWLIVQLPCMHCAVVLQPPMVHSIRWPLHSV